MAAPLILFLALALDVELIPREQRLAAYEDAIVSVRVRNSSAQAASYATARPMAFFQIGVRHEDGQPLALTPVGERELRPFTSRWAPLMWGEEWPVPLRDERRETLSPGEERVHDVWLGQWLEFERPGRYTVFLRGAPSGAPVVSFTVAADWEKPPSVVTVYEKDSMVRRRLALEALARNPSDASSYEAIVSVARLAVESGASARAGRLGWTEAQLVDWQKQLAKDVIALGLLRRADARPLLLRALASPAEWLAKAGARALSMIGDARDAAALVRRGSLFVAEGCYFATPSFRAELLRLAPVVTSRASAEAERWRSADEAVAAGFR